ncbi:MAG TPA: type I-U CRISPR-associated RAMP protein Csb1/Cas7u [Gemmatimonadales bacterium]|nr:type I-U CRISPR-associated RAMP protein Csb1/Cas7u [Gemmatimonadales bacterium]
MDTPAGLTLDILKNAVKSAAALRLQVKLTSTGGDGDKVFPPTYAGGVYAVEDRRITGKVVRCVLLDSVQSQANRMEEALLDAFLPAWRELDPKAAPSCELPVLAVHIDGHGWVNSLTAPHRVHDAILRDSEILEKRTINGGTGEVRVRFRDSAIGQKIVAARLHNATALYEHCPTALIFGTWDSTAGEGLDSAKIPRAVVSEIVGVDITPGVRTASRIDPLGIRAQATIYRLKDREDDWTLEESEAAKTTKGEPKKFGKGKPSDINHGNVTPDMPRFDSQEIRQQNLGRLPDLLETTPLELRYELRSSDGRIDTHGSFRSDMVRIRPGAVKPGGITMDYALHTWVLSFTQLRRLRFPALSTDSVTGAGGASVTAGHGTRSETPPMHEQRDEAARTVLAALALYALALLRERGYWLRSRCELVPSEPVVLHLVGASGGSYVLESSARVKTEILDPAIAEAERLGLRWSRTVTVLEPTEKLKELVRRNDALVPEPEARSEPEEEPADAGAES